MRPQLAKIAAAEPPWSAPKINDIWRFDEMLLSLRILLVCIFHWRVPRSFLIISVPWRNVTAFDVVRYQEPSGLLEFRILLLLLLFFLRLFLTVSQSLIFVLLGHLSLVCYQMEQAARTAEKLTSTFN